MFNQTFPQEISFLLKIKVHNLPKSKNFRNSQKFPRTISIWKLFLVVEYGIYLICEIWLNLAHCMWGGSDKIVYVLKTGSLFKVRKSHLTNISYIWESLLLYSYQGHILPQKLNIKAKEMSISKINVILTFRNNKRFSVQNFLFWRRKNVHCF